MASKLKVAVLGATGAVGQRFIERLDGHPQFVVSLVAGSERSQGKPYREACTWRLAVPMPEAVAALTVQGVTPDPDIVIAFSALTADVAEDVEVAWAQAGVAVFSNARNHRMAPDVPLLIPEVNPDHLSLAACQAETRGFPSTGFLTTNPNCSATFLTMALAPLHRAFGVEAVSVVTLQALSGAGYPGVPAMDIAGNVIPYIAGEEAKLETETQKMLGTLHDGIVQHAEFPISAQVNRVAVVDGHTEAISVKLAQRVGVDDVREALATFSGEPQERRLPSAPAMPVIVVDEPDRPQPALDVNRHGGMSALVGGLRPCPVLDFKMTVLGHNTVRGAAGGSILNAELAAARGVLGGSR